MSKWNCSPSPVACGYARARILIPVPRPVAGLVTLITSFERCIVAVGPPDSSSPLRRVSGVAALTSRDGACRANTLPPLSCSGQNRARRATRHALATQYRRFGGACPTHRSPWPDRDDSADAGGVGTTETVASGPGRGSAPRTRPRTAIGIPLLGGPTPTPPAARCAAEPPTCVPLHVSNATAARGRCQLVLPLVADRRSVECASHQALPPTADPHRTHAP